MHYLWICMDDCMYARMYLKVQSSTSRFMRKPFHNRQRRGTMLGLRLMQFGFRSHIKGYNFLAKNLLTKPKRFLTCSKWLKVRLDNMLACCNEFKIWYSKCYRVIVTSRAPC